MRIQPPSPPTPRAKHRRLNNRTGVCVCIFQSCSFPFFFFFRFWPRAAVFPLRSQFIYVHYFRLPDFYSPAGVFLAAGTRARAELHNAREGLANTARFGHYTALRLLHAPSIHIIIQFNTKAYLISPPSTLNRFHSKSPSCRRIMFAENPSSLHSYRCV